MISAIGESLDTVVAAVIHKMIHNVKGNIIMLSWSCFLLTSIESIVLVVGPYSASSFNW